MTQKNYDLEFLRGLSVLLVFLFHLNTKTFNSFFIGVDIFFLISGYVITSSVLKKNKFDLNRFYLRRFKRVYPNLIFILLIFGIVFFGFYKFLPHEFDQNYFSIIFSILGVSNIFYSLNPNLFYFTDDIRWLIHTWSLSIEIQYYLLIGLVFYIFYKFFKSSKNFLKYFKIFIFFLFTISFLIFISPEKKFFSDYYSFPGRLWEFALGSIAFLYQSKKKFNFNYLLIIFIISISLASYFTLNYKLDILLAVFFSYLLIVYSENKSKSYFTIFFEFFGKISYSFYLWHLILISLFFNVTEFYFLNFLIIFSLTLLLSIFTFYLIELKFNKDSVYDIYYKQSIGYILIFLSIFSFYVLIINQKLIVKSFDVLNKKAVVFFHFIEKINSNSNFNKRIFVKKFDNCENDLESFKWYTRVNCLNETTDKKLVYILGNSYGDHIVPLVSKVFSDSNLYLARFDNCYLSASVICDVDRSDEIVLQYNKISKNFDKNLIFISLSKNNYSEKKLFELVESLSVNKPLIVLFYTHPSSGDYKDPKKMIKYYSIKEKDFKVLKKFEDVIVLNIFEDICKNCSAQQYEKLFFDGHHLSLEGSLSLTNLLEKKLNF